jgi:hypothetical protein
MNHESFYLLAVEFPDWAFPWAGIGALLLGIGGTLSGIAALITARNRGRDEATTSTTIHRPDDDDGSGISDSNSSESG